MTSFLFQVADDLDMIAAQQRKFDLDLLAARREFRNPEGKTATLTRSRTDRKKLTWASTPYLGRSGAKDVPRVLDHQPPRHPGLNAGQEYNRQPAANLPSTPWSGSEILRTLPNFVTPQNKGLAAMPPADELELPAYPEPHPQNTLPPGDETPMEEVSDQLKALSLANGPEDPSSPVATLSRAVQALALDSAKVLHVMMHSRSLSWGFCGG